MLRLRPSEITLTSADVEETRRRIMHRQGTLAVAPLSSKLQLPLVHPSRGPRVRRGPGRVRDDALNYLGNIPVLKPQQVVRTSVDSDGEDDDSEERDLQTTDGGIGNEDRPSAHSEDNTELQQSPPIQSLRLPFRPASAPIASDELERLPGRLASRNNTEGGVSISPSKLHFRLPSFDRPILHTSDHFVDAQSHLRSSIDGSTEDDRVSPMGVNGVPNEQSVRQRESHVGHYVNHPRALSPTRQQTDGPVAVLSGYYTEDAPKLFLQGYFRSQEEPTHDDSVSLDPPANATFTSNFPPYDSGYQVALPHTEPRLRPGRLAERVRTFSSCSDPPQLVITPESVRPRSRRAEVVDLATLTTTPAVEVEHHTLTGGQFESNRSRQSFEERIRDAQRRFQTIQGRLQDSFGGGGASRLEHDSALHNSSANPHLTQRISEASSTSSQPYSLYELPDSRHSSSDRSQNGEQLPHSQYDGAAPSRHTSRGAYFSIRPSQVHMTSEAPVRPRANRGSSFSSPNLTAGLGQHLLSPRPATPYTRGHSAHSTPRPSVGLLSADDFVGNGYDAASAAERNLSSPLDLLGQRATSELARVSAAIPSDSSRPEASGGSIFQYQVEDFDTPGLRHREAPASGGMRHESGNSAHYRMNSNNQRYVDFQLIEPTHRQQQRVSTNISQSQSYRRGASGARSGQRSSENAPVSGTSTHLGNPIVRNAQRQGQRFTSGNNQLGRSLRSGGMRGGEARSSPVPMRLSMPYAPNSGSIPGWALDRSVNPPASRRSVRTSSYNEHIQGSNPASSYQGERYQWQRHAPGTLPGRPRRGIADVPQSDFLEPVRQQRLHSLDVTPSQHEGPSSPSVVLSHHQYDRGIVTALPDLGGRRPPIPARVASRRISAQQLNQENSGDAEDERMREEMTAAGMRYAEDGVGLDIMDETPPRIGRFERRILDN